MLQDATGRSPATTRHQFAHLGRAWELVPIILLNLLFSVLTLGLYRFWAITRVRAYLWSRTFFHDDPLEYTGTGKELFLGFLVAGALVLVPLVGLQYGASLLQATGEGELAAAAWGLYMLVVLSLTPIALYRARRYRLNRTVWRGIRWGQGGSAILYALRWIGFGLLTLVTLGLAYPWQSIALERYRLGNTYFGSYPLAFGGKGADLLRRWLTAWGAGLAVVLVFGVLPQTLILDGFDVTTMTVDPQTLFERVALSLLTAGPAGLMLFGLFCWYKAKELRYVASQTTYQGLRFSCTVTGGQLAWLAIGNLLLRLLTLGLAAPYALVRTARLLARTLSAEGGIDFDRVRQNADARSSMGEGLAAALSVGEF